MSKQSKILKRKTTFQEQYDVSLDFKKPDGYWKVSHIEPVFITVNHGDEKAHHAEAEAIARQRYPGCRINSVDYC